MTARTTLGVVLGLAVAGLVGCGVTEEAQGVQFDTERATVSYSLQYPGNLTVVNDLLVFSTANFVGSGDPELDQQFAYWEGQLWKVALAGGGKKSLPSPAGAVTSVAKLGDDLLIVDSTYMGVTRLSPSQGTESDFYNDYTHFPDDSEEAGQLGAVAVGKSGVYLTRPGSEVMRMDADGSNVEVFAKTWQGGWVEYAEQIVVLDETVFWSSWQQGETASSYHLYRANVAGDTTPQRLATYPHPISHLTTDGTRVFIAVEAPQPASCHIDVLPADGSAEPTTLVAGAVVSGAPVYDERFGLLYPDHSAGAVQLVRNDALTSGAAATPVSLVEETLPTSIALDDASLYVASYDWESDTVNNGAVRRYALSALAPR